MIGSSAGWGSLGAMSATRPLVRFEVVVSVKPVQTNDMSEIAQTALCYCAALHIGQ